MSQAFEGVRIIDFTQVFAGPFAVMQLALLGAEVIKVEQPGTGDQTRGLMNADSANGASPSFLTMNLNKQSLTLNLKSPEADTIVKALVATADVVVENFKAGTMDKLGFGFEALRAIKPDLIYCSISGYGQTGPKAGEAAYDGAIQAASGMMSQNGHPETGPTRTGFMPVDMSTAMHAAFAIASALHRKAKTGQGQQIDLAMMDTALLLQAAQISNFKNQGQLNPLQGNASPTGQPTADVFPTKDGFIQITALRQNQVEALFDAFGQSDQLFDARYATPDDRKANADVVKAFCVNQLSLKPTSYWLETLAAQGIPVAEVRDLPAMLEEPQLEHRQVVQAIDKDGEQITVVTSGYITDADGPRIRSPSPDLGSDTDGILEFLGFESGQIEQWREAGVI